MAKLRRVHTPKPSKQVELTTALESTSSSLMPYSSSMALGRRASIRAALRSLEGVSVRDRLTIRLGLLRPDILDQVTQYVDDMIEDSPSASSIGSNLRDIFEFVLDNADKIIFLIERLLKLFV